ncbi:MAG: helix-turn-helix domain-containing protein [Fibrobacterota bacterium]|nr:helix-turn-helix domain-containing protein [Fibrobacterota bacterium]
MLVHAKAPRIDVRISGRGARQVANLLLRTYKNVRIEPDAAESVEITGTEWYKKISSKLTPGKALHVYRDNARMTLAQLSEKTGIAESHLSAMENGKRGIGKVTAQKLGKALKCEYLRFL